MPDEQVFDFAKTQLTLPDKLDPADEMSWQHYLYSQLGQKDKQSLEIQHKPEAHKSGEPVKSVIEETVDRIVAMAKVLYGLHMVSMVRRIISLV